MPYAPLPHEMAYYEGLFQQADVTQTQSLNGRDAVAFLNRSKLSIDILKHIWTLADQPKTNALDKAKFFSSVRLIQLFQNGQQSCIHAGNPNLTVPESVVLRPPFFEGVTGVSVPVMADMTSPPNSAPSSQQPPSQQQQQQQQVPQPQMANLSLNNSPAASPQRGRYNSADSQVDTMNMNMNRPRTSSSTMLPPQQQQQQPTATATQTTLAAQDPYAMPPNEQSRYAALFPQYESDGHVYGAQAVALFSKSGLSKEILRDIWNMVDNPVDNRLSLLEFCIAMHLIVCVSKKNLPMPTVLPPSLKALKDQEGMESTTQVPPTGENVQDNPPPVAAAAAAAASSNPTLPNLTIPASSGGAMNSNPNATAIPTPTGTLTISDAFQGMTPEPQGPQPPTNTTTTAMPNTNPAPTTTIEVNHSSNTVVSGLEQSVASPARYNPTYPDPIPEQSSQSTGPGGAVATNGGNALPSIPNLAVPPNNATGGGGGPTTLNYNATENHSSQDKLESVQSILQKLQAENISLKAQLSHFSQEDQRTREEIHATVSEIAALSQELTGLRAQVVDAKGKLIEATSELRAQVEKRDILKSMVLDAQQTIAAIEAGVVQIQEAKEASKLQQIAKTPANAARDVFEPNTFNEPKLPSAPGQNGSTSSNVDGFVDVASAYYGAPPVQPVEDKKPAVSDKDFTELEQSREEAERARKEYELAREQAQTLLLTYEDLKAQADRQDILVTQKQKSLPKKKGFMRGSNKAMKKEIESAQEVAYQLRDDAQEARKNVTLMEAEAERLQMKALELADKVHEMEMNITQQVSRADSQPPDNFQSSEVIRNPEVVPIPPAYNYSDPYGNPPLPPAHLGTPSGMGYGGNPATPARPLDTKYIPPSGSSNAITEHIAEEGNYYGSSSVVTDSASYFGGASTAGSVSVMGYVSDAASHAPSYAASQARSVQSEKPINGNGAMPSYDSGPNLYIPESNQSGEQVTSILGGYTSGAGSFDATNMQNDNSSIMGGYTSAPGSIVASNTVEKDNTSLMGGYASGAGSVTASNSFAANSVAGGSVTERSISQEVNSESKGVLSKVDNQPSDASHGISYSDGTSLFGSTTGISISAHTETNSEVIAPVEEEGGHSSSNAGTADDSLLKINMSMASTTMTDGIPSPDKETLTNPIYQLSGSMDQSTNLPNSTVKETDTDTTALQATGNEDNSQMKSSNSGDVLELPSPTSFDGTPVAGGFDGFGEASSSQDISNSGVIPPPISSSSMEPNYGESLTINEASAEQCIPPFPTGGTSNSANQEPSLLDFGTEEGKPNTTLGGVNLMQSGSSGGIPSPNMSNDEYENPFSSAQPANI